MESTRFLIYNTNPSYICIDTLFLTKSMAKDYFDKHGLPKDVYRIIEVTLHTDCAAKMVDCCDSFMCDFCCDETATKAIKKQSNEIRLCPDCIEDFKAVFNEV